MGLIEAARSYPDLRGFIAAHLADDALRPEDAMFISGALMGHADDMAEALVSALPHVLRQQTHGKHEQDREDAKEWVERYAAKVRGLRKQ